MKIKLSKSQWETIGKTAGWIEDLADETGEELPEVSTDEQEEEFMGVTLSSWYVEDKNHWECFVNGIGTKTSPLSREDAVNQMKKEIEMRVHRNHRR